MKFLSDDGKAFYTIAACKAHEATLVSLVGLTQGQLDVAFADPVNSPLAALIERIGRELAKKRLEKGGRRRAPNGSRKVEASTDGSPASLATQKVLKEAFAATGVDIEFVRAADEVDDVMGTP